jgi:hypothetical protein
MSPMLSRIYSAPGGTEALDVLMKYMYVLVPLCSCSSHENHYTASLTALWRRGALIDLVSPLCPDPRSAFLY